MSFGPSPAFRLIRHTDNTGAEHRHGDEWVPMHTDPVGIKIAAESDVVAYMCPAPCGQRFRYFQTVTDEDEGLHEAFALYIDVAGEAAVGHRPAGHSWHEGRRDDCPLCVALDALAAAVAEADDEIPPG